MSVNYNPAIVTSGLTLYLDAGNRRSYPGSGNTWFDLSGNNYNITLFNSPTFNNSFGGGLVFNGTNMYGLGGNTSSVNNNYTLSIWFITTGQSSTGDTYGAMMFAQSENYEHGIMMQHGWTGQAAAFGGNINNVLTTSVNAVPNNSINNLIGLYNGSSQQLFLNGRLIAQRAWFNAPSVLSPNLRIAHWGYAGFERFFNGTLYSVSLYNRAFSLSEVFQYYSATRGRFGL